MQQIIPSGAPTGLLAPGGLTPRDRQRISDFLDQGVAPNTRAAYASAWRAFEAWTGERGVLPLPASPELVAAHLSELAEQGMSLASVRVRRAALGKVHRATGHEDPTAHEGVRSIMTGIARALGRAQVQAKPLSAEALGAVKATAANPRRYGKGRKKGETVARAEYRGRVDVALLSVLRDGMLRRSEASELRWGDLEFKEDGSALLQVRRSKTDQEAEGVVLYIGRSAAAALRALAPDEGPVDPGAPVFGLSARQIGRRVRDAAKAAGLGDGFTGHSGRVGMAQDLAAKGVELPALMAAGRWSSSRMPARYTERQAAGRGAVARYYQEGEL